MPGNLIYYAIVLILVALVAAVFGRPRIDGHERGAPSRLAGGCDHCSGRRVCVCSPRVALSPFVDLCEIEDHPFRHSRARCHYTDGSEPERRRCVCQF